MDRAKTLLPKGRLEAFSDGVIAIVITILVLELTVPSLAADESLPRALLEDWRNFLGYLISFVMVGGAWIAHANATRLISKADPVLFRLTLVWLLFLSLTPFTTSLMTNFVETPQEKAGVIIYGLNLLLSALMLSGVIRYSASRPELASSKVSDEDLVATVKQRNGLVVAQTAAVLCAVFFPAIAVLFYLVIALLFLLVPLFVWRSGKRRKR